MPTVPARSPGVLLAVIAASVLFAFVAGLLAGCYVRAGDAAEPPPKGWEALGLHPGWAVQQAGSRAEADRLCRALGVSAADTWNTRTIGSCAVPSQHLVILSRPEDAPHEFTHTWGQVHKNGRDWFGPDGKPTPPLTPAQAQMMLAMANAPIQLATTPAPTQTATAQPPPPRGLLALGATASR